MSSPISMLKWPTMWLPRPIRVRSPIDTTGSLTICCPGAMPADSDT